MNFAHKSAREPSEAMSAMMQWLCQRGETFCLELHYPRGEGSIKTIEIGLMDVRGADSIRVSYDFERDGWKIEQVSVFEWEPGDTVCDPCWQEVAFIQAWALEK